MRFGGIADRILGRADGNPATLTKADLIEDVAAVADVIKRDAEVMVKRGAGVDGRISSRRIVDRDSRLR